MHTFVVVFSVAGLLPLTACVGDGGAEPDPTTSGQPAGQTLVMRTSIDIAPTAGAEPIATGDVLDGSTLGSSPFCTGGTLRDSHASRHADVKDLGLVERNITCPDGTVRMVFTPQPPHGGDWAIVSGTGAYTGLHGTGTFDITYAADPDAPAHETYTGSVAP